MGCSTNLGTVGKAAMTTPCGKVPRPRAASEAGTKQVIRRQFKDFILDGHEVQP